MSNTDETTNIESRDFVREIVDDEVKRGVRGPTVRTRFPPEPNGYLHIGHAKAICLDFEIAEEYGGQCNLRFDDTNPVKEEREFEEAIKEDIRWLGFDWGDGLYYASDYFEQLYEWALLLIRAGKAYVDHLSPEEIREYRGTLTEPGKDSPYRNRTVEENLDLFEKMRNGDFEEGECVLRAKIDMASPNINLRDPTMYRIRKAPHIRTGTEWCIFPMYDWAHGQSDAIEGVTHSLCTIEYENHRPLYDWFLEQLPVEQVPRQIEFAPLNLTYTVLSKRRLLELVRDGHVRGWDDPRMPTLRGMRRRGITPTAVKRFIDRIGVSKVESRIDIALLEHVLREELNQTAPRVMAVLDPLKITIENYPEGEVEWFDADNNPEDPEAGTRKVPFAREIYIEREDFMEDPPKKFFRLAPGREIRLKHAYYITCTDVIKDPQTGEVSELVCTYDPESRGGWTEDRRKVKGTSHWVSVEHGVDAEVRVYDNLFTRENPADGDEPFTAYLNPDSLRVLANAVVEPSLTDPSPLTTYQFLRQGYYCVDPDSRAGCPIFNRTVGLRDTWAKIQKRKQG